MMDMAKAREIKKLMDKACFNNDIKNALNNKDVACLLEIHSGRRSMEVNLDEKALEALRKYYECEVNAIVSEIEGVECFFTTQPPPT